MTTIEAQGTAHCENGLRLRLGLGVLLFALGLALASARVAPLPDVGGLRTGAPWVMDDFRHVVYYPTRAFWEGLNPYSAQRYMEAYPVDIPVSLYPPASFLLFAPFGLLPIGLSSPMYFILTVLLTLVLGWAVLRLSGLRPSVSGVLAAGGILLLSRPGHWNLLSGQVTLIVVLGTYAALSFARRTPWVAGLGLALALLKPSFGIPLVPILLARGAGRAVAWGLGMTAAVNVPILLVLARREGGLVPLLMTMVQSVRAFTSNPDTHPIHGTWRVDLVATLSRLLNDPLGTPIAFVLSAIVLVPVILVSRRLAEPDDSHQKHILDGLVCCAVLLSLFHQAYDLLLLALPAAGLASTVSPKWPPRAPHAVQALLFGVLGLNYLATQSALTALRLPPAYSLIVISANGLALVALFGLYLAEASGPPAAPS